MPDTPHKFTDRRGRNLCDRCNRWQGWPGHQSSPTMPDTLSEEEIADCGRLCIHVDDCPVHGVEARVKPKRNALTAAVGRLPLYDENARTMADAAESMRNRVLAILRGES